MQDARVDGTSFRNAWVCTHNADEVDGVTIQREVVCLDLRGASVRGAVFTGAQLCDRDRDGERTCARVGASLLEDKSHNSLDGAVLP